MRNIDIQEAKRNLSEYVDMIENGQESEIVILVNGQKKVKLVAYKEENTSRRLGAGLLIDEAKPFVLKEKGEDYGKPFGY